MKGPYVLSIRTLWKFEDGIIQKNRIKYPVVIKVLIDGAVPTFMPVIVKNVSEFNGRYFYLVEGKKEK